jgi:predicted nuclease of restriction endonuclease-like (RecB) superfamily
VLLNTDEYLSIVTDIKTRIKTSQYRAVLSANRELITLYWNIGSIINTHSVWGNKFIENLARDIKLEFPETTGFSVRNLKYMAKFASLYPDFEIVQATLAQLSWYHNQALMDKTADTRTYLWYAKETIKNGWSRNILVIQIESNLYKRQALTHKVSNFEDRLPKPQSELAQQTLKDPYIFDFIGVKEGMLEREVENELVQHITKLLLELGAGFAFVGNQYHLEIGGEDFYIDLLFYHLRLRCYVVVELKTGDFKPEYAGKLNFYLSAVDDILKTEMDNPSMGILLCRNKNNVIAEYTLKDMTKPIGVSAYNTLEQLPKEYENVLPSIDDIRARIRKEMGEAE